MIPKCVDISVSLPQPMFTPPKPPTHSTQVLRDMSKGLELLQASSPLAAVQRIHTLSQLLALQQHQSALMPGQV